MKEINAAQIAELVGGKLAGNDGADTKLTGTCPVANYHEGKITFAKNTKYAALVPSLHRAVILIPQSLATLAETCADNTYVVVENLQKALLDIQDYFYKRESEVEPYISPTAKIDHTAKLGKNIAIGDYVHIGENVTLEEGTQVMDNSFLGDNVKIGRNTIIYPSVFIYNNCEIGRDCLIQSGVRIGVEGLRFVQFPERKEVRKMLQMGGVRIGDRVQIGGNTVIDRAAFVGEATIIGDDAKINNLIHIGHNSRIGSRTLIAAMSCISGSAIIGEDAWIGSGVTITNDVKIGNGAKVLLNAVVAYDVGDNEIVSGFYAMPHKNWKRAYEILKKASY
jgi:UDP-3-O-[3-hydroxymyristoyl] glucosamine N-acyltransferase